jgi:hypothetical protein
MNDRYGLQYYDKAMLSQAVSKLKKKKKCFHSQRLIFVKAIFGIKTDLDLNVGDRCEIKFPRETMFIRTNKNVKTASVLQSSTSVFFLDHTLALYLHRRFQLSALLQLSFWSGAFVSWQQLAVRIISSFGLNDSFSGCWKVESHRFS